MRRVASWLTIGFLAVLAFAPWALGCRPDPIYGATDKPVVTGNPTGDTITVFTAWHTAGPVDSVQVSVNSSHTSPIIIRRGPGAQNSINVLPVVPTLQPGDTLWVSSCIATKQGGTWTPFGSCKSALYTQTGGAVDTITVSQLDIRPKAITVAAGQRVQFCAFGRYSNGQAFRTVQSAGPECDQAFASYLTERPS